MIDTRTAPYAALILRITLGVLFLAHAGLKVFVFTPAGAAQFFGSLGLPPALAYLTILAETVGGIALILGFYTRWVVAGPDPGPARRHRHRSRPGRLLLQQPEWRLGIPGVLDRRSRGAGSAGRRRSCGARRIGQDCSCIVHALGLRSKAMTTSISQDAAGTRRRGPSIPASGSATST